MLRIPVILFLLHTVALGSLYAQKSSSKKQDAFKEYQSRSDSVSSTSLLEEAAALIPDDPAEALSKVQEALAISIAEANSLNEAKCYLLIGTINEQIGEWFLARENYLRANQIFTEEDPQSTEFGQSLLGLGKSCLELNEFNSALAYYRQARNLKSLDQSLILLNTSEVFYRMGNYTNAKKSLDEIPARKINNGPFEIMLQTQLAKIQARLNEQTTDDLYSNSLNSLRAGEKITPGAQQSLAETKEEIADVLVSQNRLDDEISLRNQAIEFNQEIKNYAEVTKDKIRISKTLEVIGDQSAALKELEDAAQIADTIHDPTTRASAYLALAQFHEKNAGITQALLAYRKYSQAIVESNERTNARFKMREGLLNKQQEIEELSKNVSLGREEFNLQRATLFRQQLIIYGLLFVILVIGTTSFFLYRSSKARQMAIQLLALKSLRSQMNPHFIFNALNSVNHFIAQQDERAANKFLSEFSTLMRIVLDNSRQDFISLKDEHEMLSLYLKLEHYRFRDKFDYEFKIDEEINSEEIALPPMLIQPYIENAVWHGLRYRESKGKLVVHFKRKPTEIEVEISDNGIGRRKSAELKTSNQKLHNSTGLKNIHERLSILNEVYKSNYRVVIEDKPADSGTTVTINFPIKAI